MKLLPVRSGTSGSISSTVPISATTTAAVIGTRITNIASSYSCATIATIREVPVPAVDPDALPPAPVVPAPPPPT